MMHKVLLAGLPDNAHTALVDRCPDIEFETVDRLDPTLARLDSDGYSLLVLDSSVDDSLDVLTRLKNQPQLRALKKLFCLSRSESSAELIRRVMNLGVSGLSYHPLDTDELARQIAQTLGARVPGLSLFSASKQPRTEDLEGLLEQFVTLSLSRLERIREAARSREMGVLLRLELEREASRLEEGLAAFGYSRGAELARQVRATLSDGVLGEEAFRKIECLCCRALAEVAARPESLVPQSGRRLLVLSRDPALSTELAAQAALGGLQTVVTSSCQEAEEAALRATPDVAVVDLTPNGCADSLGLLQSLSRIAWSVPVIGLIPEADLASRVQVSSGGAYRVYGKPVDAVALLEEVHRILQHKSAAGPRILAVDDDPLRLAKIESVLTPLGARFKGLSDLGRFWEVLETRVPDLLILDLDQSQPGGLKLCQAVRTSPRWHGLPIIVLTQRDDLATRQRVFRAGADDCLAKASLEAELPERVEGRLERVRSCQSLAEFDSLTGLATRGRAVSLLRHYLRLSQRRRLPLSLAVVDLDRFKEVNDLRGHPAGDRVLQRIADLFTQAFRSEDVVARWGGEEFVVGLFNMRREHAVNRLDLLLKQLRGELFQSSDGSTFQVSFSAGVAQYPEDGQDLECLYKAADQALYRAKELGRAQVLPAATQTDPRVCDVVLVQGDPLLGEALLEAVQAEGHRARWFPTGEEALSALSGESPEVLTRLVVLDQDLPGMSGLDLAARFWESEALRRFQVLLLHRKLEEQQILEAFDLGVFEHLSKPFSASVFMRRIERALRT